MAKKNRSRLFQPKQTPVGVVVTELVSQLRPNDTFEYGGAQYQMLSIIITVQDLKTGAAGQIDPSTLVERL